MNIGVAPMDHSEMAMDHGQMEQVNIACQDCADKIGGDLAFTGLFDMPDAPAASYTFFTSPQIYISEHVFALQRTHLAAAGPPIVPNIVSTIVLRT
jgi:hypothetical protein